MSHWPESNRAIVHIASTFRQNSYSVFIILDDWNARQTAAGLSLPLIGTVAILKKAVEKGLLADFESEIEKLRRAGFRYVLT